MANRSHVPQFGNWENEDNVPYTVFFEKARKGRTGTQMVNPNDPEDNRSVLSDNPDSRGPPPSSRSREDVGVRQIPDPSSNHDNVGHRTAANKDGRPNRSEHSVDRSPMHRQAKGRDSPSWEGNRPNDNSQGAPVKTRTRQANNSRSDDNFDKAAAVPKFDDWDKNPASAEGYTHMFKILMDERHSVPGKETEMASPQPYATPPRSHSPVEKKGCCFPWIKL